MIPTNNIYRLMLIEGTQQLDGYEPDKHQGGDPYMAQQKR